MRSLNSWILVFNLLLLLFISCNNDNLVDNKPSLKLKKIDYCSQFKLLSYTSIIKNEIEILFDDTFNGRNWSSKKIILDSILTHKYNLYHVSIFDSNFRDCIMPIMDSVINFKYGIKGKDSIIHDAYRLTEIIYKKEYKE